MNRKVLLWLSLGLTAIVALAALGFLVYAPARPHLVQLDKSTRIQELKKYFGQQSYGGDKADIRSVVCAWRECLLDYPDARDPALQLKLAEYAAGGQSPDFQFVADQVEQAVLTVLERYGPGQTPTIQELIGFGLPDEKQYRDWTNMLFVEDIDKDGRNDVIVAYPGLWGDSVCCLFRHTAQGWKPHRLVVGAHVMGIWIFNATSGGPKVIEVASLADSEYKPNLFVDAFAWQQGRVASVLSTKIPNGFELDHKDVDSKGVQAIRLFGNTSRTQSPEWRVRVNTMQVYRWDGTRFAQAQATPIQQGQSAPWLDEGKRLFEAGQFQEAASTLRNGLAKPRMGDNDYYYEYRQEPGWYYLGMSYAFQGRAKEALAAMSLVQRRSQDKDVWYEYAQKFRSACQRPADIPIALASIGQVFRIVEHSGRAASPNALPRQVMDATGLPLDSWQDVGAGGQPGGIARVHWFGGSAVVALRRDPSQNMWAVWPLAYGLDVPLPETNWYPESREIFYLPRPPIVQLYPVPTNVSLGGVESGSAPQITVRYHQGNADKESVVQWNGERFVPVGPQPAAKEDFLAELNRLETALFQTQNYANSLDEMNAFERRLRSSELPDQDKSNLLLEVFYHQALCYRKCGQGDRAAVMYAALARGNAQNAWATLAKQWVRFDTDRKP